MTRSMSLKEKILEEVIGDVKKMNGAGRKLFNEAIGQMSSTIVREEDKRKEEKEIKSDTGTMIDSKHRHQQAWKLIMIVIVIL